MKISLHHKVPHKCCRQSRCIYAEVPGEDYKAEYEQLYAIEVRENVFELVSIPFFVYNLALGDIVLVTDDKVIKGVVERSGRWVFRVSLNGDVRANWQDIFDELRERGALLECSSDNFYAIDVADESSAQSIANYLLAMESAGALVYDTGRM